MQPNGPWLAKSCWPGRQPAVAICGRVLSSCTGGTVALRERAPSHNWLPPYLLLEAELYGEAGRHEDQLQLLDEVHCLMREQGQPVGEAEVYRLRASALRARGAAAEDIDDCYQHSIEMARRQSAKFWELRAAVSRARFWCDQGRPAEAREMLANVYGPIADSYSGPLHFATWRME